MYKIEMLPLTSLKEYENNPRNSELAVEKVMTSIRRLGFLFPIILDRNNTIVCGHARKRACERLKLETVPCIRADDLTEEQLNYFRLVDNRTVEYASWDISKLESELKQIDLSLETNALVLEAFDLSDYAGLQELDDLPDPIRIPANNFMEMEQPEDPLEPFLPPAPKEDIPDVPFLPPRVVPPAPTMERPAEPSGPEEPAEVPPPVTGRGVPAEERTTPATDSPTEAPETATENISIPSGTEIPPAVKAHSEAVMGTEAATGNSKPREGSRARFSLGRVRFFLSAQEVAILDKAYSLYLDSGSPSGFVTWLLEG